MVYYITSPQHRHAVGGHVRLYTHMHIKITCIDMTHCFSHAQSHRLVMKSRFSLGKQTLLYTKYFVLNVYYACRGFPLWEQRAGEGVTLQAVCGRPDNSITDTFSALHSIVLYYVFIPLAKFYPSSDRLICLYIWLPIHPLLSAGLQSIWFIHHSFVCLFSQHIFCLSRCLSLC